MTYFFVFFCFKDSNIPCYKILENMEQRLLSILHLLFFILKNLFLSNVD